jgi:hypothetical protein
MLTAWTRNTGFTPTHSEKHGPPCFRVHMIFNFETRSSGLGLGSTTHLLLASMISAATSQASRGMHHTIFIKS